MGVMSGIAAYDHSQWLFRSGPGLPWPSLVGGGTRAGLAETSGLFGAVEPGVVSAARARDVRMLWTRRGRDGRWVVKGGGYCRATA